MLIETTEIHIAAGPTFKDIRDWSFDGKLLTITLTDWTTIKTNSSFVIVHKKTLTCDHDVTGPSFCRVCNPEVN